MITCLHPIFYTIHVKLQAVQCNQGWVDESIYPVTGVICYPYSAYAWLSHPGTGALRETDANIKDSFFFYKSFCVQLHSIFCDKKANVCSRLSTSSKITCLVTKRLMPNFLVSFYGPKGGNVQKRVPDTVIEATP